VKGNIEVICGSMFSGKTTELIKKLENAKERKRKIVVFKPVIDSRYHKENIVSHDGKSIACLPINNTLDIIGLSKDADGIGIDEAQFFNKELISICNTLANKGKTIIISGLNMDSSGNPFGIMPQLLAIAEKITKKYAVCGNCKGEANFSYRKNKNKNTILIGEQKEYTALCRECFKKKFHNG
jgi:thymidine kinase